MKKILLMLAVGIASVGLLTGCGGSSSINLTDYATVNFDGVDGKGTATVNYDLTQLEKILWVMTMETFHRKKHRN